VRRSLVLLQAPIGPIDRVQVRVGEATIEAATGLRSEQVAQLDPDDEFAIRKAMTK
jgi:hypothetical protein